MKDIVFVLVEQLEEVDAFGVIQLSKYSIHNSGGERARFEMLPQTIFFFMTGMKERRSWTVRKLLFGTERRMRYFATLVRS